MLTSLHEASCTNRNKEQHIEMPPMSLWSQVDGPERDVKFMFFFFFGGGGGVSQEKYVDLVLGLRKSPVS